jgi:hypothetical protein
MFSFEFESTCLSLRLKVISSKTYFHLMKMLKSKYFRELTVFYIYSIFHRNPYLLRSGGDRRLFDDDVTGSKVPSRNDESAEFRVCRIGFNPERTAFVFVIFFPVRFLTNGKEGHCQF